MTSNPAQRTTPRAVLARVQFRASGLIWIGVSSLLAVALALGAWPTALAAAACLVLAGTPLAWSVVSGIVFPRRLLDGILVFNVSALLLGEIVGFYVTVWWWDVLLHMVSSAVLAVFGMALAMIGTDGSPGRIGTRMLAILAFAFAMMVGAIWELMEFSLDATLGTVTQRSGLPDTMGDMAVNMMGALTGAIVAHAHVARGALWPLAGLLADFMDMNPTIYPWRQLARRVPH